MLTPGFKLGLKMSQLEGLSAILQMYFINTKNLPKVAFASFFTRCLTKFSDPALGTDNSDSL